jgi:hypothetical protein
MASFEDDEDYLCAQCARSAWDRVLASRDEQPGQSALVTTPFREDRPLPVVGVSALVPLNDRGISGSEDVVMMGDTEVNVKTWAAKLIGGGVAALGAAEIQLLAQVVLVAGLLVLGNQV